MEIAPVSVPLIRHRSARPRRAPQGGGKIALVHQVAVTATALVVLFEKLFGLLGWLP